MGAIRGNGRTEALLAALARHTRRQIGCERGALARIAELRSRRCRAITFTFVPFIFHTAYVSPFYARPAAKAQTHYEHFGRIGNEQQLVRLLERLKRGITLAKHRERGTVRGGNRNTSAQRWCSMCSALHRK